LALPCLTGSRFPFPRQCAACDGSKNPRFPQQIPLFSPCRKKSLEKFIDAVFRFT
jgi:hypothetical protein